MLRLSGLLIAAVLISACDTNDALREKAKSNPKTYARMLAADKGCMSCHSVSITVVGPAWKLVAKEYKDKPEAKGFLISKIKKGGKGNWDHMTGGEVMPGHEDRMTDDEIAVLVDYILAL